MTQSLEHIHSHRKNTHDVNDSGPSLFLFKTSTNLNKKEVSFLISNRHKVTVLSVNVARYGLKRKLMRTKYGSTMGSFSGYKKFFVKIKEPNFNPYGEI